VQGTLRVPGDKSISHRYVLFGALADGTTTITNLASGQDVAATVQAVRDLGVDVTRLAADEIRVSGRGLARFLAPPAAIDAVNSGTTMRLLAGVLAGGPVRVTLTGDASLQRRPMLRVIEPLTAMGGRLTATAGRPPIEIEGMPLHGIDWRMTVPSAQVKSAVLLAALAATGTTRVHEPAATRDHTERAFPAFGLDMGVENGWLAVRGGQRPIAPPGHLRAPGDASTAAVWACAAAALPGSSVTIEGISLNPRRIGWARVLERMGARIDTGLDADDAGEPTGWIRVAHDGHRPATIAPGEVPGIIDELPVLAARAALGGGLEVSGASELRVKESDRITALVTGLRGLGVAAEERADGFVVDGTARPSGGSADAAHDHRLVMTFALVALGARGPSVVTGADAVAVSYPDFGRDLERLTIR
jgi:3-phosphoshikimate 1-carboxyvinyltransferase